LLQKSKLKFFGQIKNNFFKDYSPEDRNVKLAMLFSLKVLAYKSYLSGENKLIIPIEKFSKSVRDYIDKNESSVSG
jgi:hypothetical protein